MTKVNYVRATFGGKEVEFRLKRDDFHIRLLEAAAHAGIYEMMRAFLTGTWRIDQLKAVLYGSHPNGGLGGLSSVTRDVIDRVLVDSGAGVYAVLAAKILEAHLFGLDPSEAVFHEAQIDEAA